jgi:hypothetical protein
MPATRREWLTAELGTSIEWFRREANKHKRVYNICRYSVFALSVASSILAAIALAAPADNKRWIDVAIIACTAMIGLVTSVEGMRKPADKWHTERRSEYSLLDVRRELEYSGLPVIPETIADACLNRMQSILKQSGESWSKHQQSGAHPGPATGDK